MQYLFLPIVELIMVSNTLLNNDLIHYVLTSNRELKNALVIPYEMEYEHSFISLNSTCVPMAILLKYYLGDEFLSILNEIFSKVDKDVFIDLNGESIVNIFYSDKSNSNINIYGIDFGRSKYCCTFNA